MTDDERLRLLANATSPSGGDSQAMDLFGDDPEPKALRATYQQFAREMQALIAPIDSQTLVADLLAEVEPPRPVTPQAAVATDRLASPGRSFAAALRNPWFAGILAATVVIATIVLFDPMAGDSPFGDSVAAAQRHWHGYEAIDRRLDLIERETATLAAVAPLIGASLDDRLSMVEEALREWSLDPESSNAESL